MVLLKAKPCPLSSRQALLTLTLSTSSPTLSLSSPSPSSDANEEEDPFRLKISLRIEASAQPSRPITIATSDTVLDPATLSQGSMGALQSTSDPSRKISLGNLRPHIRHPDPPPVDMRQRPWLQFITIPAADADADADPVLVISHDLPLSRIFKFESDLRKEDIKPGEEYSIGLDPAYVGTMWWCWGDLNGDLKDRKFSEWRKGWEGWNFGGGVEKPEKELVEKEEWVVGEDPEQLWVEDRTAGAGDDNTGRVVFKFVE